MIVATPRLVLRPFTDMDRAPFYALNTHLLVVESLGTSPTRAESDHLVDAITEELSAGDFEGVHEGQLRGSGAVIIWDEGPAEVTRDEPGHLTLTLHGSKLAGGFALTRTGERRWILVKTKDATARPGSDIVAERPASVRTGRTWVEVAAGPSRRE